MYNDNDYNYDYDDEEEIRPPDAVTNSQLLPSIYNTFDDDITDAEKQVMEQSLNDYLENLKRHHDAEMVIAFERESLKKYKTEMLSKWISILKKIAHYYPSGDSAKCLYEKMVDFIDNEQPECLLEKKEFECMQELISERYYIPLEKGRSTTFTSEIIEYTLTHFISL